MNDYHWIVCKDPKNRLFLIGSFQDKAQAKRIIKRGEIPKPYTVTHNNYKDKTNMIEAILTSPLPKYRYIRRRFGIKKLKPKEGKK